MTRSSQEQPVAYPAPPEPAGYGPSVPVLARPNNGLGTAALVLGILAVIFCWTVIGGVVLGIVAVVLGLQGRARVRRREASNRTSANAGWILGVVAVVASAAVVVVGISVFNSPGVKNLRSCLADAHGNQAAITACDNQFNATH